jgi:hypothetical protein
MQHDPSVTICRRWACATAHTMTITFRRKLCFSGAGVYFDDPGEVGKDNCRSRAGVILDTEALAASGLPTATYKANEGLQTEFPYHSCISIYIAVAKVYPALKKACDNLKKRGELDKYGECIEVWDRKSHKATFHAVRKE